MHETIKFLIVTLALVAAAMADVSELSSGYDYHAPAPSAPVNTYIPPVAASAPEPVKTYIPPVAAPAPEPVKTYIPPIAASAPEPVNTYIPPVAASEPVNTYIPPVAASAPEPTVELAQDGYRYKTQRHRVYRKRA
ncbi:uncharacterized protein LOC133335141 [Musca vetustissima]|uniref:uncharacterized protein LOC133335141 n=1 Tax=Musca vetustissima TaxID=27455 RepID=UPI002AB67439|nr:uncharacterized protein LOC133335141 [Musca vetustissima]